MYNGEFAGFLLTDAAALLGTYTYNDFPILAEFDEIYTQIDQRYYTEGATVDLDEFNRCCIK